MLSPRKKDLVCAFLWAFTSDDAIILQGFDDATQKMGGNAANPAKGLQKCDTWTWTWTGSSLSERYSSQGAE